MASELHVDAIKHSGGTSAITIVSDGTTNLSKTPHWRLVPSANVDIADSSWTQVAFDTTLLRFSYFKKWQQYSHNICYGRYVLA